MELKAMLEDCKVGRINYFWACPRPLTGYWGSGQAWDRILKTFGTPDIVFGVTDGIPDGVVTVDSNPDVNPTYIEDWSSMPFIEGQFEFGYWDPPYLGRVDKKGGVHYSRLQPCYDEIVRVTRRLAILHPLVYPKPRGWEREAVVAVTYGPNKIIRCLQVFKREVLINEQGN